MNRQDARESINSRPLTDFITLTPSPKAGKNHYQCPICGSGTGPKGTGGLCVFPDSNRVFCFVNGCFTDKGQDTIGALRTIWACTETEAIKRAGYDLDGTQPEPPKTKTAQPDHAEPQKPAADYTLFYRECHEALKASPDALEYLHRRGISDYSIERFNLGYCERWKHPGAGENVPETRRIIIPRTNGAYLARRIEPPKNDIEANFEKQVAGRQKDLFNLKALDAAETLIICEGEFDAISLYQAGAAAVVGIGPTTNAGAMLAEAKKHPETVYILALDNDEQKADGTRPGQDTQKKLAAGMAAAGLSYIDIEPGKLYGDAKDANAAFVKDPERLKKVVSYLMQKARELKTDKDEERAAELRKRTGEGMLEDFLLKVKQRDFEPIATGISDLDRALAGGFTRKTLVMLGAPPAMGKTALAQWIFENMATAGHDVLYINLEMSREQLLARSLSRIAWRNDKTDLNALDILRGYAWTEETQRKVMAAAEQYKADIAGHFIYNPDGITNNIDSILSAMEAETARIKAQGKPAPLICIDYLQLIDSGERDAMEGLKNVIFRLKSFACDNNTICFVIMANNRASNKSGTAELESGRDSSAIEYSADTLLALVYTAIEDRRQYKSGEDKNGNPKYSEYDLETIRRLKKEAYDAGKPIPVVCNEVSLKVLKNRFGDSERRAHLIFDGAHATFTLKAPYEDEDGEEWIEI